MKTEITGIIKTKKETYQVIISCNGKGHYIGTFKDFEVAKQKHAEALPGLLAKRKPFRKDNTSGVVGVYFFKNAKKWVAQITVNKNIIAFGLDENKDDAIKKRKKAESLVAQGITDPVDIKNLVLEGAIK